MRTDDVLVKGYFACSRSERACFEAGVKLGALFHQFVGAPLNERNASHLEKAMMEAMMSQPFVVSAEVMLDKEAVKDSLSHFGYCSLEGRMIDASVVIEVEEVRVLARLRHVKELRYPLMWVERVYEKEKAGTPIRASPVTHLDPPRSNNPLATGSFKKWKKPL